MPERFYISTPIYYPNGEPHLGHFYATLCADVVARYHRLRGDDTFFLTGTDEHGIKMVQEAAKLGIEPGQLAARNTAIFKECWSEFGFSFDDFIHTTEDRHKREVIRIVERMLASGDIYLGAYEGWYDEGQEQFVPENEAKENDYKSAISGRPLTRYKESTYFFKLTKYVGDVYRRIESDELLVRPIHRKNEVLSKLKGFDQDLSISRATLKWGIPMPNDPGHVLYVWIDALSNYITALDWPGESGAGERHAKYWPCDVHLIGKEILWFHAVYWPAMLLSVGQPLPKMVYAHGWWVSEGKKMSKSMGNFIDIAAVRGFAQKFSLDTLRYYMLRVAPFGNDLDFVSADLQKAYESDLGNVLGNLLNRALNMTQKYRNGIVPGIGTTDDATDGPLRSVFDALPASLDRAYANLELQQAALLPIELARAANAYVDQTKPFSLAKDPAQSARLDTVLNLTLNAVKRSLVALIPIMPAKAVEGLGQLGVDVDTTHLSRLFEPLGAGHALGTPSVLFPRLDPPK